MKLIPGFWESLREEVLYRSEFLVALAKEEAPTEESKQYMQKLFDQWLLSWGIVDEWLMDATRHTVLAWATIMVHEGRGALEARAAKGHTLEIKLTSKSLGTLDGGKRRSVYWTGTWGVDWRPRACRLVALPGRQRWRGAQFQWIR